MAHDFINLVRLITFQRPQFLIELLYQSLTFMDISTVINTVFEISNRYCKHIWLNEFSTFAKSRSYNIIDNIL